MEAMPEIRVPVRYIGARENFYHPHFTGEIVWNAGDVHELPASRAKEILIFTDTFERADLKKEAAPAPAPAPAPATEASEQSADEAQAQALAAASETNAAATDETGAAAAEPTAEEIAAGKSDQPSGKKGKRQ